jgi:hypothetical protein
MQSCWQADPNNRPAFTEICSKITNLLEDENVQYNYVDAVNVDFESDMSLPVTEEFDDGFESEVTI